MNQPPVQKPVCVARERRKTTFGKRRKKKVAVDKPIEKEGGEGRATRTFDLTIVRKKGEKDGEGEKTLL